MRRPSLPLLVALLVGLIHAVAVIGVQLRYGYDVGPAASPLHVTLWRYGGLVVLGAVQVWLALRYRLVTPLALVAVLAAVAFHAELTPPDPVFRDVAELEPSVEGPTGITVVENGLHLAKYAGPWYVWTVAAGLVGLWEAVVRRRRGWVPDSGVPSATLATNPRLVAVVAGLAHALASVAYAWGWGMSGTPVGAGWALVGGVAVVGVPVSLLLTADVVWPTLVATLLFVNSVHAQQYAGPGDPHALYAGGWFVFLAVALLPGAFEYGLRRVGRRFGGQPV
ncbi:hypothetical protein [Haloarcula pelagica]|uniref:hypothetical protein n=1 Tax=Haloarcula pelagica TaxID=3033389 RepID=UPI0024C2A5F6|nr:hypothetical protein [Halomicroarcula sp. YJ-61-S]